MKRWIIRLSVLLLILLIAALVTAHFVLKGDLPRRMVVDILREQTGLRVDAASMSVSWSGRTVIEDLEIALPLEEQPFLTARRVRVSHNSLIMLALTRSLGLSDLRIVDPIVSLEADEGDQWNIIEAAEIVSAALERNRDPNDPPSGLPELPRLRVERAVVDVDLPDGRSFSYQPFAIIGDPDGTLAWDFALTLEDRIALGGRLSPGAGWGHRIDFAVDELRSLVEPFVSSLPVPLDAAGAWRGDIREGTLAGTLTIAVLRAGDFTARGTVSAELVGTQLEVTPSTLIVERSTSQAEVARTDQLRISSGTVTANLETITASRIVGSLATGSQGVPLKFAEFQAGAEYSITETSGTANIDWRGNAEPLLGSPLAHTGSLRTIASVSPLGEIRLTADLVSTGQGESTSWDIASTIDAFGPSFQTIALSAVLPRAVVSTSQGRATLDGAAAELTARWPALTDIRLSIPDADRQRSPLLVTADLDTDTMVWNASADADGYHPPITVPALPEPPPLTITLRARGDRDRAILETLTAHAEGVTLQADGRMTYADLDAQLSIVAQKGAQAIADSITTRESVVSADISGSVSPLDVRIAGEATVAGPAYRDQLLGDVSTGFSATITDRQYEFVFEPIAILGGQVGAIASYTTGDAEARIAFLGERLSLGRLAEVLDLSMTLTGEAGADLSATIPLDDPAATVASGTWTASQVNVADRALINGEGTLIAGNGSLRLPQINLRHADGSLRGSAEMDLERPDRFHAAFSLDDWPLELDATKTEIVANGDADLTVHLAPLGADGTAQLAAQITYRDQPAGTVSVETSIAGRDLSINSISADALGGTVRGGGLVPLSAEFWERARFDLQWSDIDFSQAHVLLPALEPLRGTTVGSLTLSPSDDFRAELPLELVLQSNFEDAAFKGFTLGVPDRELPDLKAVVHFGPDRAEITEGSVTAAGGTLDIYGRISDHGGESAVFITSSMNNLDLQQIASAASLDDGPMPGRVNGDWSIGGSLMPPHRLFGSARMTLTDSDLLALPGIAQLYSALSLNIGRPEPQGEGKVLVRLEGESLEITRLVYFNRGTDLVAAMTIEDIFNPADSPIEGTVVGSIRPLRAGPQSFLSAIDRLLRAAQANAVAVEIGGTLSEPDTSLVPLKDLTSSIQRLLRGRVD